jgi:hypothetical protein
VHVYLIGLNHGYQLEGLENYDWASFSAFLEALSREKNADLIAEELSQDAIDTIWKPRGAKGSVAKRVADNLAINHLFCEPNLAIRRQLGIKNRQELFKELGYGPVISDAQGKEVNSIQKRFWVVRESFWKKFLLEKKFARCIFILGSEHIESFGRLLEAEGATVEVVAKDWTA